jgi:hypothetical protein
MRTTRFVYISISSQDLLQLCYPHIIKEIMEILHFYIIIKSEVGVDFDVPLRFITLNNIQVHLISSIMYEYL